jgi:hypothetical protein
MPSRIPRRPLDKERFRRYFESDKEYLVNNRDIAVRLLDEATWAGCCRASNRLADLVCMMYHPKDEMARKVWPTATWAEIIASELGIEVPGEDDA